MHSVRLTIRPWIKWISLAGQKLLGKGLSKLMGQIFRETRQPNFGSDVLTALPRLSISDDLENVSFSVVLGVVGRPF